MKRSLSILTVLVSLVLVASSCGKADPDPLGFGLNNNGSGGGGGGGGGGNIPWPGNSYGNFIPLNGIVQFAYPKAGGNMKNTGRHIKAGDQVIIHSSGFLHVNEVTNGFIQFNWGKVKSYNLNEAGIKWYVGGQLLGSGPFLTAESPASGYLQFGFTKSLSKNDYLVNHYTNSGVSLDHIEINTSN